MAMAKAKPRHECTKRTFEDEEAPRKIRSIKFGLMSGQDVEKMAELEVTDRTLFQMPERTPMPEGVLDARMGTSDKKGECETCGGSLTDCAGHYGYVQLELPVFHIGYFKTVLAILQCICKSCASLMLSEEDKRNYLRKFRNPKAEILQKRAMFKRIADKCKRLKICPACGDVNGFVRKVGGSFRIVHDKYAKNPSLLDNYKGEFKEAIRHNENIAPLLNRVQDDLNPIRALGLLRRITPEDCELLDLAGRPEQLITTHIPVPPVCIRPSVALESAAGSNEDDITMKLAQIVEVNNVVRQGVEKGLAISNLMENWDFLQMQCAMYINSEMPGLPLAYQPTGKPLRGFVQRLKGKQGRFRGNLSGKRVDFSSRTVISPDPNLSIDEVAIPYHVAETLTYPEKVTRYNIEKLKQRVINGMEKHPGANFVYSDPDRKWYLKYCDRDRVAAELRYGDVVDRHLEDGDIVLFNRQPSLHKMSIMAHRVRVMPWKTFRFNECVCAPYNADFDGDEMNLHVLQTEEARAEALTLMGVSQNLCTPKNGEILVSATQDFLTCSYLLTRKDRFFTRAEFAELCCFMGDARDHIELPGPAICKPMELWTGKQLFGMIIQPNRTWNTSVTFQLEERMYSNKGESMCVNDGYVLFSQSELLCGQLGKKTLGGGKVGLFSVISNDRCAKAAAVCMNRLAKLSARWIGNIGFSIGIDDVSPSHSLNTAKEEQVGMGYDACNNHIGLFKKGELSLQPGCNAEQTLEAVVTGELNKIREEVAQVCMRELQWYNSALIMSQCGSKGSPINISQMVACVGQQTVSGERVPNGFSSRTLPHFYPFTKAPDAKGFVANSFYSGLSPTEFFFHTMAGREGLVDTAVKTAETGYMSRRLMKALEDLSTQYDGTVRNSTGGIVQLVYGDDGLDPVHMEGVDGEPVNFTRVMLNVKTHSPPNDAKPLSEEEMKSIIVENIEQSRKVEGTKATETFLEAMRAFLMVEAEKAQLARGKFGLSSLKVNRRKMHLEKAAMLVHGLTEEQIKEFVDECIFKFQRKAIEPGSAVGAVGAQSIGEPGTQMTLKTFHFAGVASMNVTLGVPRIKEIINASKNISTPIMKVELICSDNLRSARIVKGRIEKTLLGEVSKCIRTVLDPSGAYVEVVLNKDTIEKLQLDVDSVTVARSVISAPKLKVKVHHITVVHKYKLSIACPVEDKNSMFFFLQYLERALPKVIVKGIPAVERAVINDCGGGKYNLLVEGTDMLSVMTTEGVLATHSTSNHVMEIERTLGIEAARRSIMDEVQYTMQQHGMSIDTRHAMLLADVMTYKGEVLGITRNGIAKMKDSVLMLASFEKTTDHLFDAAIHGRMDEIVGVSECIIMGIPIQLGTGSFQLGYETPRVLATSRGPPPLLV